MSVKKASFIIGNLLTKQGFIFSKVLKSSQEILSMSDILALIKELPTELRDGIYKCLIKERIKERKTVNEELKSLK